MEVSIQTEPTPAVPLRHYTSERVSIVRNVQDLEAHRGAWDDLSRSALEENVFYEPWMLIPALQTICSGIFMIFVWADAGEAVAPLLIGLFPLAKSGKLHGLPLKKLSSVAHLHCYLGSPLIRRGYEQQSLRGFFNWWDRAPEGKGVLEFRHIDQDGEFCRALTNFVRETRRAVTDMGSYSRAFINLKTAPKDYLETRVEKKVRKELRRKQKRFSESGELRSEVLSNAADLPKWLEQFLNLERSGWKGEEGSALGCTDEHRTYFERITREGFAEGRLLFLRLLLNGQVIAMKHSLIGAGGGVAYFKIAHDEQNSKFSPGQLLEFDNLKAIFDRGDCTWVDSCTDPKNIMCNQLLRERRNMRNLVVAGRSRLSKSVVRWMPLARRVYQRCRGRTLAT